MKGISSLVIIPFLFFVEQVAASLAPEGFEDLVGKRFIVQNPIYIRVTRDNPETFYDENEGLYYATDAGMFTNFDASRAEYGALENEEVEVTEVDWKTYEAVVRVKSVDSHKLRNAMVKFKFSSPEKFWELFYQAFGKRVQYQFELVSKTLEYTDRNVSIFLQPSEFGIGIKIKNKLNDPITIDWSSGSFVNVDGDAQPIIHSGVRLINKEEYLRPTVIPPEASITDVVVPSSAVEWTGSNWKYRPIFPLSKNMESNFLNDKTVRLFLPVRLPSGKVNNVNLVLKIKVS